MWLWGTVVVVDRRRGLSSQPGALDFNRTNRTGAGYDGDVNGPVSGGGG
ncbi:MAG TPA: hypothetical protein VFL46_02730 [Phycicoccus sp.]|nr:hypothetical protein [Phycicoccus sp.]